MTGPFRAAVLAGGASRRMGRPKPLVPVDGRPMGAHVVDALRQAGAHEVALVGGEAAWATSLGVTLVADRWPGEGPLAGLATALGIAGPDELMVVTACDQPDLAPQLIRRLVGALRGAPAGVAAAVPLGPGGRHHPFPCAWWGRAAGPVTSLVEQGARRADAALEAASPVAVPVADADVADIDTPGDLARRMARHPPSEAPVDVPEIDIATAARRRAEGVPVFDVREIDEYEDGHVPGAELISLATVPDHLDRFPTDGEALIICKSGGRSMKAAEFLRQQGIAAVNVAGGTMAWIDAGHEVAIGDEPGA